MFSVCPLFGNPFESSHKVGFSCTVKIQKKGIFNFFFFVCMGNCSGFCKIVVEPYGRMF